MPALSANVMVSLSQKSGQQEQVFGSEHMEEVKNIFTNYYDSYGQR
jgi:hypothetical protein